MHSIILVNSALVCTQRGRRDGNSNCDRERKRREEDLPPRSLPSQHTMTTRLDILALKSTVLTGTMCLHALLCVNIPLTNTRVKELKVKKEQR